MLNLTNEERKRFGINKSKLRCIKNNLKEGKIIHIIGLNTIIDLIFSSNHHLLKRDHSWNNSLWRYDLKNWQHTQYRVWTTKWIAWKIWGLCKGVCKNYITQCPTSGDRCTSDQIRCTTCSVFLTPERIITNEKNKCKCCHFQVCRRPWNS